MIFFAARGQHSTLSQKSTALPPPTPGSRERGKLGGQDKETEKLSKNVALRQKQKKSSLQPESLSPSQYPDVRTPRDHFERKIGI